MEVLYKCENVNSEEEVLNARIEDLEKSSMKNMQEAGSSDLCLKGWSVLCVNWQSYSAGNNGLYECRAKLW